MTYIVFLISTSHNNQYTLENIPEYVHTDKLRADNSAPSEGSNQREIPHNLTMGCKVNYAQHQTKS
jgi:hypothetical protein